MSLLYASNPTFGLIDGGRGFYFFGLPIHWYAVIIITGALLALASSNYRCKKRGFPGDSFDTPFIWAFPGGIIGARIWYVIATWPGENGSTQFTDNFWNVFKIWEGGLAIQGGAIGGVLVGVIFILIRRKGWNVLDAMDCVVPTILIGQIFGRWGNFVNQEVYGMAISDPSAWGFLGPIMNRMYIRGDYRVPLFFLESLMNCGGYFVITRLLPFLEGRRYRVGDQAFFYFFWYGLIRMILEPLRDPAFNMGADNGGNTGEVNSMQAVWMGLVFVIAAGVAIFLNHLIPYLLNKKKEGSVKNS